MTFFGRGEPLLALDDPRCGRVMTRPNGDEKQRSSEPLLALYETTLRASDDSPYGSILSMLQYAAEASSARSEMNCWHCERPAHGVCAFCGRAVCKDDAKEMPHIAALYRGEKGTHKAIVTAKALFCGLCEPREDPVELPELQ